MFEPVHGSAPDIAGKNIANPVGMIWSAAMMLEFFSDQAPACQRAAQSLMGAIERVLEHGPRTPDLGGSAATTQVGQAVADQLASGVS